MLSVTLRLLSLVALGVAQTTTVSVWVPPTDSQLNLPGDAKDLAASIVGSAASSTTYVLDCASKVQKTLSLVDKITNLSGVDAISTVPDVACGGFPAPYTIVQGPSTVIWNYDITGADLLAGTASVTPHAGDCLLSGATEAVCTITDGTQSPSTTTYRADHMTYTHFAVAAGAVAATSTPISASMTERTKKEAANSTVSHAGIDSGADSATRDPSARTKAMSGSSGLSVYQTGSIAGISSVKAGSPTSAPPKSTNIGVQGSSSHRDGVFGALVIALAGAIL